MDAGPVQLREHLSQNVQGQGRPVGMPTQVTDRLVQGLRGTGSFQGHFMLHQYVHGKQYSNGPKEHTCHSVYVFRPGELEFKHQ